MRALFGCASVNFSTQRVSKLKNSQSISSRRRRARAEVRYHIVPACYLRARVLGRKKYLLAVTRRAARASLRRRFAFLPAPRTTRRRRHRCGHPLPTRAVRASATNTTDSRRRSVASDGAAVAAITAAAATAATTTATATDFSPGTFPFPQPCGGLTHSALRLPHALALGLQPGPVCGGGARDTKAGRVRTFGVPKLVFGLSLSFKFSDKPVDFFFLFRFHHAAQVKRSMHPPHSCFVYYMQLMKKRRANRFTRSPGSKKHNAR